MANLTLTIPTAALARLVAVARAKGNTGTDAEVIKAYLIKIIGTAYRSDYEATQRDAIQQQVQTDIASIT